MEEMEEMSIPMAPHEAIHEKSLLLCKLFNKLDHKLPVYKQRSPRLPKISKHYRTIKFLDNLKSKAKEVNRMMEPVGFQEMLAIV